MSIVKGTTPTFTFTFSEAGLDLTDAAHVYVTFSIRNVTVTKSDADLTVTENTVSCSLTQAETLQFITWDTLGDVPVATQVNWTYAGGLRAASEIQTVVFTRQLLNEVVS